MSEAPGGEGAPPTPPAPEPPAAPQAPPAPSPAPPAPPAPTHEADDDDDASERDDTPIGRMRRSRQAAQREARGLREQLASAQAQLATVETLRRSLLEQTVIAHATGQLADPADAIRLLDLADVKVGDDGRIDVEKVKTKVAALVAAKPYLANGHTAAPSRPPALPGGGGQQAPGARNFNDIIRQAAGLDPR